VGDFYSPAFRPTACSFKVKRDWAAAASAEKRREESVCLSVGRSVGRQYRPRSLGLNTILYSLSTRDKDDNEDDVDCLFIYFLVANNQLVQQQQQFFCA